MSEERSHMRNEALRRIAEESRVGSRNGLLTRMLTGIAVLTCLNGCTAGQRGSLYQGMARDYLERGDVATALERANTAVATLPDADSYAVRGAVYARAGNNDRAIEDYNHALTLSPGNAEATRGLAEASRLRDPGSAGPAAVAAAAQEDGQAAAVGSGSVTPSASELDSAIADDDVSYDAIDGMVAGLVAAGDRSPVLGLTQRLQTETNPDTLYRICRALGDFRDPYPVPVLIALAQHNEVRDAAFTPSVISALGMIGDGRARDPLCDLMCHARDKDVRNAAQEAVFNNQNWRGCECEKASPAPAARQQQPAPRRK